MNLISVPSLYPQDITATFAKSGATLLDTNQQLIATFPLMSNNLHAYIYKLDSHIQPHILNMNEIHTDKMNITEIQNNNTMSSKRFPAS